MLIWWPYLFYSPVWAYEFTIKLVYMTIWSSNAYLPPFNTDTMFFPFFSGNKKKMVIFASKTLITVIIGTFLSSAAPPLYIGHISQQVASPTTTTAKCYTTQSTFFIFVQVIFVNRLSGGITFSVKNEGFWSVCWSLCSLSVSHSHCHFLKVNQTKKEWIDIIIKVNKVQTNRKNVVGTQVQSCWINR